MSRVLFVCIHNSGRSQMAEAIFNHFAREKGLSHRAESAGTLGGDTIHPGTLEATQELGISMEGQYPKQLTAEMIERADRIITMGCGVDASACPARFLATEDWGLDDPAGKGIEIVRPIRDEIVRKVHTLINELALDS